MAALTTDELLLLRTITPIILEVVTYFTSDAKRATNAQERLAKKDPDPSYAALWTDLKDFETTLRGVPEHLAEATQADLDAISDLLSIIEKKFLVDTEDERELCDYETPDRYPSVCFLLTSLRSSEWGPSEDERLDWLITRSKFEHPRRANREKLVSAIGLCHAAVKTHARADIVDISWAPETGKQSEWPGARSIYMEAEALHAALKSSWICRCQLPHREAKFSFDLSAQPAQGHLGCTLFYPSNPLWLPARLQYQTGSNGATLSPDVPDVRQHRRRSSQQRSARLSSPATSGVSHICDLLRSMSAGGCLGLSNSALWLRQDDDSYSVELFGSPTHRDIALRSWSELIRGHDLRFSKLKHRLTLALILSYAYLHLGGGPWWPYQRGEDNVSLYLTPDTDGRLMKFPFFTPSLTEDHEKLKAPQALILFNRDMPSLPAFGKLLFELALGRWVDWQHIEKEMRDFEDEMFANEILAAVRVCTGFGDDKTFTSGGRIRDNERLRMHFVNEVVLKIQHVLDVAYGVQPQDIFDMPDTQASLTRVASLSDCDSSVCSVTPEPPSFIPAGFCLHDGHDAEELQQADVDCAKTWMHDLERFIEKTFDQGLARDPPRDTAPVKIAVIDTGAAISRQDVQDLYEGRLIESRSWLHTTDEDGIPQFDVDDPATGVLGGTDEDGHGTHATSSLLQSTYGTDIEVYVAQVFSSRAEKLRSHTNGDQKTADAIARAIQYAVDRWEVDVISMSFGFPQSDEGIDKAIEHAYSKKVLMLAAASNCGGTGTPSWPAKSEHVMCIHATTGLGNKYLKNPTPWARMNNFAVLGTSVEALWLPLASGERQYAHKSGTSTATPIAAGIAGLLISIMRRSQAAYLETRGDRHAKKLAKLDYKRKLDALGRPSGMGKMFRLMVEAEEAPRDGYTFLMPSKMYKPSFGTEFMLQTMLSSLPD